MRRLRTPITLALTLAFLSLGASSAQAAPPTIPYIGVSEATTTSITLEADINPQGKGVSWHFEYGPADCASNPCTSVPGKDKVIVAGTEPVRVAEPVEGLTPGTTYHYRVVAKNGAKPPETAESPDRLFGTYSPPQVFKPCSNDSLRKGASALLPDCRAYEQVSPVNKNGGDVTSTVPFIGASPNGDAVTFMSDAGIPGGEGSQELPLYLASRGKGGWSTQGLLPPGSTGERAKVIGWLPDYSQTYSVATRFGNTLSSTFFARSSSGGPLATISPYTEEADYFYAAATEDGSTVFFETGGKRSGGVFEGKSGVYAWDRESGKVVQASVLNDGEAPPKGAFAGSYDWILGTTPTTLAEGGALRQYYTQDQRAVSADGTSVYFTASGSGELYLRRNPLKAQSPLDKDGKCLDPGLACTIRVSASQRTIPDPAGTRPAAFQGASADGAKVFFTSTEMLTDDANTGPEQESAAIARSDLDGKPESIDLDFIPTHAKGLAVDDEYLYWANPGGGTIGRAKLNGKEIDQAFIATGPGSPQYVTVRNGYLYWTNAGEEETDKSVLRKKGTIGCAKLGPSGAEDVKPDFITGASFPQGIAVSASHIYWTNANTVREFGSGAGSRAISRAELDGTGIEREFILLSNSDHPSAAAVNAMHFYWADYNPLDSVTSVFLRDLDGNPASQKRAFPDPLGKAEPFFAIRGIALDDEYVYWASEPNGTIGRVELGLPIEEPSDAEVEFIKGLSHPVGIAVSDSHIYWSSNGEAPPNPGNDLYRYDADTGELIDISADASVGDPNGAEVRGMVGVSEDGSRVYFVANGDLDDTGPATPGNCSDPILTGAGICNLYLWHQGEIRFVARLSAGDSANWAATPTGVYPSSTFQKSSRVTPDGRTLLFRSQRKLTAYDNEGVPQLYLYSAEDESILCVSCSPTGKTGTGGGFGSIIFATLIPTRPASVLSRVLSGDGRRVFFESTDPLVSADVNGEEGCPVIGGYLNKYPICQDVYQWEAQGKGSCERPEGCLYLLSTGTEKQASHFAGASASGDDVFIFTRSKLVGQDTDLQRDIYDLRVEGGLSSQYPQPKPVCEAEGCKPPTSTPPASQSAGTAAFSGPANPKPNRRKKARHKRKKQRKSTQHKRAQHRAHAERRAQR
jgi:hypothetical protein